MAFFINELRVKIKQDGNSSRLYVLIDPFTVYTDELGSVTVPAGFETDFASVPRVPFALWLLAGVGDRASVVHDYLCRTRGVSREVADRVFVDVLSASGVSAWRRALFYLGVRVGSIFLR